MINWLPADPLNSTLAQALRDDILTPYIATKNLVHPTGEEVYRPRRGAQKGALNEEGTGRRVPGEG
jgi:hypothetical protein